MKKEKEKRHPLDLDAFELFWEEYPRKVGKKKARDAWRKISVRNDLIPIMKFIEAAGASTIWDDPQYIPHPATFLNGERWNDEIPEPSEPKCIRGAHPVICEEDGCRFE